EREWVNLSEAIEWCLGSEQYDLFKEFWLYLGGFTRFGGYWDERLAWLDCLLEVATRADDRPTIARILLDKVHTFALVDRPAQQEEAIALCQEALAIPDGLEFEACFNATVHLTLLYLNLGDISQARKSISDAKFMLNNTTFGERERLKFQIYLWYYQGQINTEIGELSKARELYQQCLQQARQLNWQLMIIYTYSRLAIIEIEEGNFEEAERLLQLVLTSAEQNCDKRSIAFCQRYYALLEQKRENLVKARHWALLAKENFKRLKMLKELREIDTLCRV
ncbi:MAG: tetratricopeptide repeat protein, partial [Cyanobacteria bacterium SBLK]|nr:tetratricopeptide repeat protein [Cyanobacteria bacterium SBLK]